MDENEYFSLRGIQNIRAGRFRALARSVDIDHDIEKLNKEIRELRPGGLPFAQPCVDEEEVDYLDLRFNVLNIMEEFVGRHQELLYLVSVKDWDIITFVPLLNVALLVMFFSSRLGFAKDDVMDLGITALYRDIGKLYISSKIIKKEGRLSEQEFLRIKDHPLLGAKILERYKDSLGHLPIVVAYEHHLRYDLTGYPKMPFPQKPHLASLMISICDVYDALVLKRFQKRDYPPDKIYEVIMMEKGRMFAPEFLDKFFQFVGLWPVGTIVALSDGRVGAVRQVSEQAMFRPTVEILEPQNDGEIVDLRKNDRLSIVEALNPHGKGRKYLLLIRPSNLRF